jgi:triacylglycerol lipase
MSVLVELPQRFYEENRDAFGEFAAAGPYDIGTARAMAWMSQLAYETAHRDKIESVCGLFGLRLIEIIANDSDSGFELLPLHTRGVIAEGHGAIIVAFSGTDPLIPVNWITDFDVGLKFRFNERVTPPLLHRGFETAFKSVADDVTQVLANHGETPVLVTGHSMGAALAVIAADHFLSEKNLRATAVYALGMPRVGDEDFASRYNKTLGSATYRLVHGTDIVAAVPPSSFGFRHVGRLISCARGTHFAAEPPVSEFSDDPQFRDSLLGGFQEGVSDLFGLQLQPVIRDDVLGQMSRLLLPHFGDHLPDRYLRALGGVSGGDQIRT